MKNCYAFILQLLICLSAKATDKDSTVYYNLPDSVKASQFFAEVNVQAVNSRNEIFVGIKTDVVRLSLNATGSAREVEFEFPLSAKTMATGLNIETDEKGELRWNYNWSFNQNYKLMISTAADSAGNFSLYSGYIWLPKENKWKLIGTCKIEGRWNTMQNPASFYSTGKRNPVTTTVGQVWIQRNSGSWKNLKDDNQPAPTINLFRHIDSMQQRKSDIKMIEAAIASGKTDTKDNEQGIYYKMIKEGTGKQVSVNDTVTVNYKGYLFANDSMFDQTKEKPATFPLKRLIKGWQIGVPLCKVGGRIKLIIPSDLAYSIRTRAAKIPPNSILVFEIEVLDAKPSL